MDTVASIIILTLASIASTFVMLNVIPRMLADTGAQELDQQQQTLTMEGYCSTDDCVVKAIKECRLSETTIIDASNATKIIVVGGDGVYQGLSVCMISIYEENLPSENTNLGSFQSWSCKVPVAELSNSTNNREELVGELVASARCSLQVP